MSLAVVGERALWLTDKEKAHFLNAVEMKGLFGPPVAIIRKKCKLPKEASEAFNFCRSGNRGYLANPSRSQGFVPEKGKLSARSP